MCINYLDLKNIITFIKFLIFCADIFRLAELFHINQGKKALFPRHF